MWLSMNRIIIYAKNVEKIVTFYERHFGFKSQREEGDRIIELIPSHGGTTILIYQAAKSMKEGQACIKLVFDIEDVLAFRANCALNGLKFGAIHQADGYIYANAKDPGKNSIQISSRAFRKNGQ